MQTDLACITDTIMENRWLSIKNSSPHILTFGRLIYLPFVVPLIFYSSVNGNRINSGDETRQCRRRRCRRRCRTVNIANFQNGTLFCCCATQTTNFSSHLRLHLNFQTTIETRYSCQFYGLAANSLKSRKQQLFISKQIERTLSSHSINSSSSSSSSPSSSSYFVFSSTLCIIFFLI